VYDNTWWDSVGGRDLSDEPVWDRYLAAIYFTVGLQTTDEGLVGLAAPFYFGCCQ